MITTAGKERIAELIDADLNTASLGTSSQVVSAADTALVAEVTSTIDTVTSTNNGRQLIIDYELGSTAGNGTTYTEYGIKMSDGTLLNRIVFTGVPKTSSIFFQVKTILNVP